MVRGFVESVMIVIILSRLGCVIKGMGSKLNDGRITVYEQLIDQWLSDELTGDARALAIEIIGAVIDRARTGDPTAAEWLRSNQWLLLPRDVQGPAPQINVVFGRRDVADEERGVPAAE